MDKQARHVWMERGKDVLIVLLTLSALWLVSQGRWTGSAGEGPAPGERPAAVEGSQPISRVESIRPLRIMANGVGAAKDGRCAIQYNLPAADNLFQQTAGLLVEALSSAEPPTEISRAQWESALIELPGLTFDFQGSIPLEVLLGWLTGESTAVEGSACRLVLAVHEEQVALYYQDTLSSRYYRSTTQAVNRAHLEEALAGLSDNGAYYAFERDWGDKVAPDTLFQSDLPPIPVYTVHNPVGSGREALEPLMEELGFSVNNSSFYTSGDELVARDGDSMLRLSERGTLHYEMDHGTTRRFAPLEVTREGGLPELVGACQRVVSAVMAPRAGEARLYLKTVHLEDGRIEVCFGYALNGIPVSLSAGYGARFLIEEHQIIQFDLQLRSYTGSGTFAPVMPPRQAVAALSAMELEGRELQLAYSEAKGGVVSPGWAAVDRSTERK